MKAILLFFSFSLLMTKACGPDAAPAFVLNESFTLAIGQELSNADADLKISLMAVTEDSRCPKGTNCVWEGEAKITLLINGETMELTLRAGKPDQAQALYNNSYLVEAQTLTPYPDGAKIDPASYQLAVLVSSL